MTFNITQVYCSRFSMFILFVLGLSVSHKIDAVNTYHYSFYQGNYYTEKSIKKLCRGMDQHEIISLVGRPVFYEYSNLQVWHYIFLCKNKTQQNIYQENVIMYFDQAGLMLTMSKSRRIL